MRRQLAAVLRWLALRLMVAGYRLDPPSEVDGRRLGERLHLVLMAANVGAVEPAQAVEAVAEALAQRGRASPGRP